MKHPKIAYHEALAYKAERENDHAEAHRNWQQAEYYKREKITSHVLHRGTRRKTERTLGNQDEGAGHSKRDGKVHKQRADESAPDRMSTQDRGE